jgi:signal transduction histidine kinase
MVPRGTSDVDVELARLRASLAHAQRLATLGTVSSLIAHEFNNILTPVMSYAQMALAEPHDAVLARKALERAADGTERAAQIAAAILDFARADLDSTAAVASIADIDSAISGMLNCLARDPKKDRIELRRRVPCGAIAYMRPIGVQQVLLNLVLNARRAIIATGRTGVIEINVAYQLAKPTWPTEAVVPRHPALPGTSDGWITFTVSDNGPGIDPHSLDHIFMPFASCSGSGNLPSKGTGLGLTVCQQLVFQAGGFMWATSTLGVGSTFAFVVPGTTSAGAISAPREARAA